MTTISKSNYMNGLKCPKLLWTIFNDKEKIPSPDEQQQHIFDQGTMVGKLAQNLYPNGVAIQDKDIAKNLEETKKLIKTTDILFEAAFSADNIYARTDILIKNNNSTYDIVEVKSTAKVKDEHLPDLAFQRYCLEKSGIKVNRCHILHINTDYVKKEQIYLQRLFTREDVTDRLNLKDIQSNVNNMLEVIQSKQCPKQKINMNCHHPYECPLTKECWGFLPKDSVFNLYNIRKEKSFELAEQGIGTIDLVVVNVKPFGAEIGRSLIGIERAIEMIDVGGAALLSETGPEGTLADIEENQSSAISVYVVREGDTLSEIADMFGVSVNTIIWANNLKNALDVHPGDILIILPVSGIERTVVKGDSLKSLANKYGGDANEIAQFNGLDPAVPLQIGSTIIIPGGEIVAPPPRARFPSTPREPYSSVQTGYYSNPLPGGVITQGIHGWNGVDIGAARGAPIYAAAKGTVIIVRNNGAWNGGYGNYVVITHDNASQTLYSHLQRATVSFGATVTKGQIIGYVGTTGRVSGPHLHFEVRGAANPFRNCRVGSVCSPQ